MIDLELFETPPPKLPAQMHSETSRAAAKRERLRQNAFKWQIFRAVKSYGPITDNQLYVMFAFAKQGTYCLPHEFVVVNQ